MKKHGQILEQLKDYSQNGENKLLRSRAPWGMLILPLMLIVTIEGVRLQGQMIPIPFLMLYGSVIFAALVGGLRVGLASAVIVSGFIVYSGTISVGPLTLVGGIIPISLGIVLHIVTGILVGHSIDRRNELMLDVETLLNEKTQALQDSKTLLQSILDYSPTEIYLRDLDCRYVLVNHQYEIVSKWTREQIKGKTPYDIFTKEAADLFCANDRNIIETQQANQFEEVISQPNGKTKTYLTSLFPVFDSLGEMSAVGGISTDITERQQVQDERQQNEERYRDILDAVSDYAYLIRVNPDKSIHFEWLTGDPENVIGYTEEEFREGSLLNFVFDLTQTDFHDVMQRSYEALMNNERTQIEVMVKHKNGRDVWLRISRQPVWDDTEQRVTRYYGAVIDITQEKKAEDTLREQEVLKVALEKEKELRDLRNRYLSTIAHDFRTPLTSISMSNEILENYSQKLTEEQTQGHRRRITQSVNYLEKMLEELSLIARVERGYLEFTPTLLHLQTICTQIVDDFMMLHEGEYQIIFEPIGAIGNCCLDEDMLGHILLNLLSNAIKYSPKDSTVILRLSKHEDNLKIDVIDEGIGIPEEDQARLFEPFHRANNVGTVKGSGIGLSIVKEFVTAHSGDITYTSAMGKGTTFTITIPIREDDCGNDDSVQE